MARPPKATEELLRSGTFRADRHGDRAVVRLSPGASGPDPVLAALDRLLADERPAWLTSTDDVMVALLRSQLVLRGDLAALAGAGDVVARRDLLALDRMLDGSLDALGLTTASRIKLGLAERPTSSRLADLQAAAARRRERR